MFTKEQLTPDNYTNPRKITITGKEAIDIYSKVDEMHKDLNSAIEEVNRIEEEYRSLSTQLLEKVREEHEIGEFEEVRGVQVIDDETVAEVYDTIEELIQRKRERDEVKKDVSKD